MCRKLLMIAICGILLSARFNAQSEARVKHVTGVTAEKVRFDAWVDHQIVKLGQDITVNYRITNNGARTIYLVTQNFDNEVVVEDDEIVFPRPFVLVSGHDPYDYNFRAVKSGLNLTGQLTVPPSIYKDSSSWLVLVGFGYVSNITGLTPKPSEIRDPIPYKALLSSRIKTLQLGGLYIEITED